MLESISEIIKKNHEKIDKKIWEDIETSIGLNVETDDMIKKVWLYSPKEKESLYILNYITKEFDLIKKNVKTFLDVKKEINKYYNDKGKKVLNINVSSESEKAYKIFVKNQRNDRER